jgi:hypothetical protein
MAGDYWSPSDVVSPSPSPTPSGSTPPPPPPLKKYEAENATISQGTVATNHLGFSGTGFVDYTNVTGSYVEWKVTPTFAGTATLSFRFANGTTTSRPMDIKVNGTTVASVLAFGSTTNWDTWKTISITAPLNAGTNTVRATATTANGGPNVDYLTLPEQLSGNSWGGWRSGRSSYATL